ncbi:Tfp pilus assembly protein FimT/FimU [Patescibacteria group bacterium]
MKNNGFTLIEILIVMSVIVIITTIVLVNFRGGERGNLLKSSVQEVVLNLRKAQNMAITAQKFGANMPYGYGVYFSLASPQSYIIFADMDNNQSYTNASENFEVISMSSKIEISSLNPASPTSFIFTIPEAVAPVSGSIDLRIVGTGITQSINVTNAGVIDF